MSSGKTAVIAGAGPAGLTAAFELLALTDVQPIVLEADAMVGGLAKTVVHDGNRMDIGGHRFFSKSTRVMDWWLGILPLERPGAGDDGWLGRLAAVSAGVDDGDLVMLVRERVSRILYERHFYDYPVTLNANTIRNLGLWRMARIGASYLCARLFPIRDERTLEEFLINRFGRELYTTFFEEYTEKVWGVPCSQIKADWGAQRIKGLSMSKAIAHALRQALPHRRSGDVAQRTTETSLIERFLYPKLGPGQLWEEVARIVEERGGEVRLRCRVVGLDVRDERIVAAQVADADGVTAMVPCDHFISTMPVRELAAQLGDTLSAEGREIAAGLEYRDFITVGVLLRSHTRGGLESMPDNWIYVQEPDVKVGRLQIFNNWSPSLVADPDTVWIGMEYFAAEGDALWSRSDEEMSAVAVAELETLELVGPGDVLDTTVLRVPKAYPAYFGSYDRFDVLRAHLDRYPNLYLIGRNGMHRYNNQDHSMLTAMVAVENIAAGLDTKDNIWSVNVEQEYHETKSAEASQEEAPAISA
jgi:protoporphyrinogen oxidase